MLFRSVGNLLEPRHNAKHGRREATPQRSCRLSVDALEDRRTPSVMLSVGDATIVEGDAGVRHAVVTVAVSKPHGNTITVNYNTADGTATAGSDYSAVAGKLTFAKNEMSKSILVPIIGNRVPESDEWFSVRLSNPKGASIADGVGIVTIEDDEPQVTIGSVSQSEGTSGTTTFTFPVWLSTAYDLPVTVSYTTSDGSASAGVDYTAASGTLTFAPGQTSRTITVQVDGDRVPEPDRTFFVNVSTPDGYAAVRSGLAVGTILDSTPRISIEDHYYYGGPTFSFAVRLSIASDEPVTVDFATRDGTAHAGVDYIAASGTLTFAPGETLKLITVHVIDPTAYVAGNYFQLRLSRPSGNSVLWNELALGIWYYDDGWGHGDYGIGP